MSASAIKKHIRPDIKGRVSLGSFAKNVSSFNVWKDEKNNLIILEPNVEIPAREKWLFDNEIAMNKVKQGIKDSAQGKTKKMGGFARYKNEK